MHTEAFFAFPCLPSIVRESYLKSCENLMCTRKNVAFFALSIVDKYERPQGLLTLDNKKSQDLGRLESRNQQQQRPSYDDGEPSLGSAKSATKITHESIRDTL